MTRHYSKAYNYCNNKTVSINLTDTERCKSYPCFETAQGTHLLTLSSSRQQSAIKTRRSEYISPNITTHYTQTGFFFFWIMAMQTPVPTTRRLVSTSHVASILFTQLLSWPGWLTKKNPSVLTFTSAH